MYYTYRFKHPAIELDQNAYGQFFYGSVFFSVFLYLFSFYFIYQTTEILKYLHSESNSTSVLSFPVRSESIFSPTEIRPGESIVPPLTPLLAKPPGMAPFEEKHQIEVVPAPQVVPQTGLPLDVSKLSKLADKSAITPSPVSLSPPITNLSLPFSYVMRDSAYEVNFGESEISFKQRMLSHEDVNLHLQLTRIQSGSRVFFDSDQESKIKPFINEKTVSYERTGEILEFYNSQPNGVEQSWIFRKPLQSEKGKDLVLTQRLKTELKPRQGRDGALDFYDSAGNYVTTYGKAVIQDAFNKTIQVYPTLMKETVPDFYQLSFTVPGQWMSDAAYPVVLDPLIGNKLELDTLTGGDYRPSVAFDGTNYFVVWMNGASASASGGTGASNIYGAVVSPAGTIVVAPFVIDNSTNDQMYPHVAYNTTNNNFLVVYQYYVSGTALNDIYGKVISYSGSAATLGTATAIIATTANEQYPSVASDGTNTTNNNYVAYATTTGGVTTVSVIPVSTTTTRTITPGTAVVLGGVTPNGTAPSVLPSISYGLNGTFIRYFVAWENFSAADNTGNVYGNNITKGAASPGLAATSPLGIAITAATAERYPSVGFGGNNFLVGYQRSTATAASNEIYGQFVTSAATPALSGSNFDVSNFNADQTTPAVAYNTALGTYLFAWTDARNGTTDIYGARVTPSGTILDPTGVNISNIGTSGKMNPAIASGGPNFYIPWRDQITNTGNIYGQLVGPPQISSLTTSPVDARSPLTINSTLYGTYGTFGPDPGSANRATATFNVTWGGSYTIANTDVTSWGLTPGINSSIGITVPYGTAIAGGVGPLMVTSSGFASTPNPTLTVRDFSLTTAPSATTVSKGATATYTVTMAVTNSFTTSVNLTLDTSGPCPSGATCTFTPAQLSGSVLTSTLTVNTSGTSTGTYNLVVKGTSSLNASLSHLASLVTLTDNDFSLSASPATATTTAVNSTTTSTITVTSLNSFNSAVGLGCAIAPVSATVLCTLSAPSVTPAVNGTATSTLSVGTTTSTPAGIYTVTVTGTSGSDSHTTTYTVTVADFSLSAAPASATTAVGNGTTTSTITVTSLDSFNSAVGLGCTIAPVSATVLCSLSAPSVTPAVNGTATSTLSVGITSSTPTGIYTVTVTGTSGSDSHTTTYTLTVGDFSLSASPATATTVVGNSTTTATISVTSLSSFNSAVGLSCSITPVTSTMNCSFSAPSVTPAVNGTATSTLSVGTTSSTPASVYTVTITGVSGADSHNTSYTLTVGDFSLAASPASATTVVGNSTTTSTITVSSINGFNSAVGLTCSISPVTSTMLCSLSAPSVTPAVNGTATSTLSVGTTGSTPSGTYTVTVPGTSGSDSHTVTYTLTVSDFSIGSAPTAASTTFGTVFTTTSTITVTSLSSFNGAVGLNCGVTPSVPNVTCGLTASSLTPVVNGTAATTLTVVSSATTSTGIYTTTVTGTSGSLAHSATDVLTINGFSISAAPASAITAVGNSTSTTITVGSQNGFSAAVGLTCAITPVNATVTCSLSPASVTPAANGTVNSTLTVNT
ncbi:MAG: beta strand repeat-containing protein, partial [Nitrospiria bacterium]